MERFDLLQDLTERTGGAIYIGVVGPVRTGKSTFIKRFMEELVLPQMEDAMLRQRLADQLPQSGTGRTIMTTEPKFVPEEPALIETPEGVSFGVRLVDCVGYAVPQALGYTEDDEARLVYTSWSEEPMPFEEAAEIGTRKVIADHSTIGLVVTTDGSFSEIPRESYLNAEQRVIEELQELGKPFMLLLNSAHPYAPETLALRSELETEYGVPVMTVNAMELQAEDIYMILQELLYEFPVTSLNVEMPDWVRELPLTHALRQEFEETVNEAHRRIHRLRDVNTLIQNLGEGSEHIDDVQIVAMELGSGRAHIALHAPDALFDEILSDIVGVDMSSKAMVMFQILQMATAKKEYDKFAEAISVANNRGYGIVPPDVAEMALEEPEIIRQGGRFGVRLKASAPAYHFIRVNVLSEVTPIIGTEKQSEELVRYLLDEFEADPQKLWGSHLFGKSLHEMVREGIQSKLDRMPEDARDKVRQTLEKIVNEGNGGLIAILF